MRFDFDETFGADYLHFYAPMLTDERSEQETDQIIGFLDLEPGAAILDAPCGHGRISNRLAGRGYAVTGVDASELFLDVARESGTSVDYRHGDLRRLPADGPFDAVVCWFTSFGYFDDDDNRRVLAEFRRVLRPGGRLLIETHNRDELLRRFISAPAGQVVHVGEDLMVDTSEFDCVEGRIETDRIAVRDGQVRRSHHSVRFLVISEWREWLAAAKFTSWQFFARDGHPPSIHRPRLVVVATA
jgi:SAM-dependent methyltransferase